MTLMLELDPVLRARVEAQAAREGRTVEQFVHDALDRVLGPCALEPEPATSSTDVGPRADAAGGRSGWLYEDRDGRPLPFPVFYGGSFPPGVDPRSSASLSAGADAEEDEKYLRFARGELP